MLRLSCERAPNARLRWLLRPRKIATSLQCSGIFGRGGTLLLILLLLLTDDVIITVRTSADDPTMVFALASVGRDARAGEDRVATCLVLPPTPPFWRVGGFHLPTSLTPLLSSCRGLRVGELLLLLLRPFVPPPPSCTAHVFQAVFLFHVSPEAAAGLFRLNRPSLAQALPAPTVPRVPWLPRDAWL